MTIAKEVKELTEEMNDIIDTLKGVKGEKYVNALLCLVNVINMNKVMAGATGEFLDDESLKQMDKITGSIITDVILRLASLLDPDASQEDHHKLCSEMATDARMLVDKQNEYSKERP